MKDSELFTKHVMFCNSTGNQTINLIPALQFNIPEIIIYSTDHTEKTGLSERLLNVIKNRRIKTSVVILSNEEEKNPLSLIDKLLFHAKKYEKIIWNISGGQKIPTIALQTAFQRRINAGFKEDILLYLEAKPPETWYYDSSFKSHKVRTKADTNLKEILFLYGYDLYEDKNEKMLEIYPSISNDAKEKLEVGRKALNYYIENDYFREAFFNWMKPYEPDIKNKNDIRELIRYTLNQIKPKVNDIKLKKAGYEKLEETIGHIIKDLHTTDINSLKEGARKLKIISKPEELFNDYWNGIKGKTIEKTIEKIDFDEIKLLRRDVDKQTINNLKIQIEDIGGVFNDKIGDIIYKKDIYHFSALRKGNGFLYEWMVAAYLFDIVNEDECLKQYIGQIHWSVKTKPFNSQKHDAELDLVITTKFGTLITIELKTYDFSGDTAKAKEGTTFKKSGPYGKAVIVGPLLKSIVKHNYEDYPYYIDGTVRSQQETAERNGIEYWYLDDIPSKIKQKMFCNLENFKWPK